MTAPLVLISAAMAVPSGFYRPLVAAFEERGWEAQALPTRGFERGEPTASREHDWSYDDGIQQIADAVGKARADQPDRPVIVFGHSLGSQFCLGHELNHPPSDGFVSVGAGVPHFRHYPYGGVPLLVLSLAVPVVSRLLGHVPKPFFGAPGARTLMTEWAGFMRTGTPPFPAEGTVRTPSLVIQLQGDALAVSTANKAFVARFLDPDATTRWVYTRDAAPEGGSTDHVRWAKTPGPVVDQILTWWTTTHPAPHR
ncbi:hydrolase [Aeromicrobium sp. SMF47]|uniref:Hydrolase n=1 Tax=Aeromicrobium yanjiei TaxID=2662028 RepID=A0A5Q2MIA9_9ACTN|nr:alpha/beta hydrolase [Aeromicrobium yanjiei]MRJ77391.1 hydrolase [Aeromicrobium yanjiei]QGG41491.1 hydrolase [Aeromicrobium yanjiei]